jgi:hypothetical protein
MSVSDTDSKKTYSISFPAHIASAYSQALVNSVESSYVFVDALIDTINEIGGVSGETMKNLTRLKAIYDQDRNRVHDFVERYSDG